MGLTPAAGNEEEAGESFKKLLTYYSMLVNPGKWEKIWSSPSDGDYSDKASIEDDLLQFCKMLNEKHAPNTTCGEKTVLCEPCYRRKGGLRTIDNPSNWKDKHIWGYLCNLGHPEYGTPKYFSL